MMKIIFYIMPLGWINYHLSDIYSRNYQFIEQINAAKNTVKFISSVYGNDYIGLSSDYQLLRGTHEAGAFSEADKFLNKSYFEQ